MTGQRKAATPKNLQRRPSLIGARVRRWARAGLDLLFPRQCECCGAELTTSDEGPILCPSCLRRLATEIDPCCRRCGAPTSGVDRTRCARCDGRRFHFDAVFPLGLYRDDLRRAVLRMKEFRGRPLAAAMGRLVAERLGDRLSARGPELATPVPMHWIRRLGRGSSSPEIIAAPVARRLRIPLAVDLLRCARNIKKQSTLPPTERFKNVRGAYRASLGYDIKGAHVLLIDDILTTGATAGESARVLREAGAAHVTVAVVARAVGPDG